MNPLMILSAVATALFTVNTAAEVGSKIDKGVRQGRIRRAEHRYRPSPQKAARMLRAELRKAGQDVVVKPVLPPTGWELWVTGGAAGVPPLMFAGYPVRLG